MAILTRRGSLAERAEKRAAKAKAKETAAKLASNDWVDVDGMWAALATEGRGHREGPHYGRKYRVVVPREDFGEFLFLGGQVRFTQIEGGDSRIYDLPTHAGEAPLAFNFDIDGNASGGTCVCVDGMQVRRAPV